MSKKLDALTLKVIKLHQIKFKKALARQKKAIDGYYNAVRAQDAAFIELSKSNQEVDELRKDFIYVVMGEKPPVKPI